ncbi:MAG TPA: TA system VapC family ribonuclease toxin [Microbacterium sp.]|uniref:TA system VapC family ribonuclease toxin n=1 Tax=Microbacterium sp. TaxID=51671 RepID=UPI002C3F3694|nr:TA system VapC family ribonuclease toxin [Microbacterium sp.]HWI31883.1 TA system VapC family ribonuclease toxin [Microbacterium sp.]
MLDVNVLIAAFRSDHVHHTQVLPWLRRTLDDAVPITAPDTVWVGFVRLTTNHRIFEVPATLEESLAFVSAMTAQPTYVHVGGLLRNLGTFVDVCREASAIGNLVTDAYIAAIAVARACPVATLDRDFRRFEGLKIVTPSPA